MATSAGGQAQQPARAGGRRRGCGRPKRVQISAANYTLEMLSQEFTRDTSDRTAASSSSQSEYMDDGDISMAFGTQVSDGEEVNEGMVNDGKKDVEDVMEDADMKKDEQDLEDRGGPDHDSEIPKWLDDAKAVGDYARAGADSNNSQAAALYDGLAKCHFYYNKESHAGNFKDELDYILVWFFLRKSNGHNWSREQWEDIRSLLTLLADNELLKKGSKIPSYSVISTRLDKMFPSLSTLPTIKVPRVDVELSGIEEMIDLKYIPVEWPICLTFGIENGFRLFDFKLDLDSKMRNRGVMSTEIVRHFNDWKSMNCLTAEPEKYLRVGEVMKFRGQYYFISMIDQMFSKYVQENIGSSKIIGALRRGETRPARRIVCHRLIPVDEAVLVAELTNLSSVNWKMRLSGKVLSILPMMDTEKDVNYFRDEKWTVITVEELLAIRAIDTFELDCIVGGYRHKQREVVTELPAWFHQIKSSDRSPYPTELKDGRPFLFISAGYDATSLSHFAPSAQGQLCMYSTVANLKMPVSNWHMMSILSGKKVSKQWSVRLLMDAVSRLQNGIDMIVSFTSDDDGKTNVLKMVKVRGDLLSVCCDKDELDGLMMRVKSARMNMCESCFFRGGKDEPGVKYFADPTLFVDYRQHIDWYRKLIGANLVVSGKKILLKTWGYSNVSNADNILKTVKGDRLVPFNMMVCGVPDIYHTYEGLFEALQKQITKMKQFADRAAIWSTVNKYLDDDNTHLYIADIDLLDKSRPGYSMTKHFDGQIRSIFAWMLIVFNIEWTHDIFRITRVILQLFVFAFRDRRSVPETKKYMEWTRRAIELAYRFDDHILWIPKLRSLYTLAFVTLPLYGTTQLFNDINVEHGHVLPKLITSQHDNNKLKDHSRTLHVQMRSMLFSYLSHGGRFGPGFKYQIPASWRKLTRNIGGIDRPYFERANIFGSELYDLCWMKQLVVGEKIVTAKYIIQPLSSIKEWQYFILKMSKCGLEIDLSSQNLEDYDCYYGKAIEIRDRCYSGHTKIKNGLIGGDDSYKAAYVYVIEDVEYLMLVHLAVVCEKKTFDMNDRRTHSQRIDMLYGRLFRLAPVDEDKFLSDVTAFPLVTMVDFEKDLITTDWFPLIGVKCPACLVAIIKLPPLESIPDVVDEVKTAVVDEPTLSDLDARAGLFDFTVTTSGDTVEEYDGDDEEVKIDVTYDESNVNRRYVFTPDNLFPLKSFVEHCENKIVVDMPKWKVPNLSDIEF